MKLPYGISNFKVLRSDPYFYVDRTPYIERMEALGERYIMFLRPRRFGKSLFISTLEHHYGIEHKDQFSELFGGTYIGRHPTPEASTYQILRFDFSGIETTTEQAFQDGFLNVVKIGIQSFVRRYSDLSKQTKNHILSQKSPAIMIREFFEVFHSSSIYLLIDEYDHFANEILARDYDQFLRFVARDGFVRKFYEVIKTATGTGLIKRLFITGVTPITMDSLTSGFNILKHLSLEADFNEMMGFTYIETHALIDTLYQSFSDTHQTTVQEVMEDLKRWYNGYRFNPDCEEKLYNPDMVLHFASAFAKNGCYPKEMIDTNIASDYGKIRRLFQIKNTEQNYTVLEQLIEEGQIQSELTAQFSFEKSFEEQDFISLLFYLGFISVERSELNDLVFSVPNHVIQRLYWDYFMTLVEKQQVSDFQTKDIKTRILKLAQENQIKPFLELIESSLKALSNRDSLNFDEKYIKALFVGFANLANIYFIHSEREIEKKYPDIMLLFRKPIRPNYQFVFELKYLKKSEASDLDNQVIEAENQLRGYLQSDELKQLNSLKAWVIVFIGDQLGQAKELVF